LEAVIIITFNTDRFLEKQIELYNHFVGSRIIVCDNSTDYSVSNNLRKIAVKNDIEFVKVGVLESDSSKSHGFALNTAYNLFKDQFDVIIFSDHDIFPVRSFDISDFMEYSVLAGIIQIREKFRYFWPGFLAVNNNFVDGIDFMPKNVNGVNLDTGAGTWEVIQKTEKYIELQEVYHSYKGEQYSVISDTFMHFVNGSNWKKDIEYEDKMAIMLEALEQRL
jgi:hypothetical protein